MNKIIIVDDHSLFREGIKLLIENEGLGEIIAEAENGQVFLELLKDLNPDLVLMDIEMPVMSGLEASKEALKMRPDLKILVVTMLSEKTNYYDMINAGVMGYILKTSGKSEFEKAIKATTNGESFFSTELLRQIIVNFCENHPIASHQLEHEIKLTEREKEVLDCFCNGLTTTEIANKLFLSNKTIEAHRAALIKKTNSKNTINLVLFAIKNKLFQI